VSVFDLEPSIRHGEPDGMVNVVDAKAIGNIIGHEPTTRSLVRCRLLGSDKESVRHPNGLLFLRHCRPRCLPGCVEND
jgi:hypothetical protein